MRSKFATSSDDRDKRAQQAAYLRAVHNFSQEEIGKLLGGMSQSHVSRLLSRAIEMGWLVTELRFVGRDLSAEALREIQHLLEPRRLVAEFERASERTNRMTPNVRVFDSGSESPTQGAFEIRCRRFGRSAAGRIKELLQDSQIVGLTWGRTVSALIDGLTPTNSRYVSPENRIIFTPVSAELLTLAAPAYSSSLLAGRLNTIFNDGEGEKLGLGGVPAYIPRRYEPAKIQAIREYLGDASSYRRIFSGDAPLVDQLDTVLTSVGSAERPLGGAMSEILAAADISVNELKGLIVGDVGGILIPRHDASAQDVDLVEQINGMWTGITRQQLSNVARRSVRSKGAGVIVAAVGRERAPIIADLIRMEMINELIIDWDLARALEAIIGDVILAGP